MGGQVGQNIFVTKISYIVHNELCEVQREKKGPLTVESCLWFM